jgi:hypothetical protein
MWLIKESNETLSLPAITSGLTWLKSKIIVFLDIIRRPVFI